MTMVKKFLLCLALSLFAGLAAAEYAVIVNKDLPFDSLELIEIQNIYLAKTGSFPDGSWVIPVDQEKGTPQRLAFYESVLERSESQIKSYFSRLVFTGKGSPPEPLKAMRPYYNK